MRLGQLARKLDVKPAELVKHIAKVKKTEINPHPNSKVDDYVDLLTAHFSSEKVAPETVEKKTPVARKATAEKKPKVEPEIALSEPIEVVEHIETIKAEKLSGPKIIAKIELPPPPPPEMIEVDGVMMEKSEYKKKKEEEKKQRDEEYRARKKQQLVTRGKVDKKEVSDEYSFEKKKIQEEKELERRLKKQAEVEAKKRKEHYLKNHAPKSVVKKRKSKEANIDVRFSEPIVEVETNNESQSKEVQQKEEGVFKRIWKWFNT